MARDRIAAAIAVLAGCTGEATQQAPAAVTPATPPAGNAGSANPAAGSGAATPLASGPEYRVDTASTPPCTPGARCELRVVLTALGAYKVNKDYPTKFVPVADDALALEAPAAFEVVEAKRGVMTLALQRAPEQPATLRGTFKLSVCTDDNCEIEAPAIAIPVSIR